MKNSMSFQIGNVKLGPHESIIGFEIDVSGGGFESMSSLPKGWHLTIDNKSASHATVNADLSFGSDGLTVDNLKGIVIKLSQAEQAANSFDVIGHMLVNNLGTERRLLLSKANFIAQ